MDLGCPHQQGHCIAFIGGLSLCWLFGRTMQCALSGVVRRAFGTMCDLAGICGSPEQGRTMVERVLCSWHTSRTNKCLQSCCGVMFGPGPFPRCWYCNDVADSSCGVCKAHACENHAICCRDCWKWYCRAHAGPGSHDCPNAPEF